MKGSLMRYVALAAFVATIVVLCWVLINIYALNTVGMVGVIGVGIAAALCAVVITAEKGEFRAGARMMAGVALATMAVLSPSGFSSGILSNPTTPAAITVTENADSTIQPQSAGMPQVYIEKK